VAGITGLPRSPAQVIDVILLGSIAEELIFRGVIWSILVRLSQKNSWIMTLVGTSLLFGVMHFGYWHNRAGFSSLRRFFTSSQWFSPVLFLVPSGWLRAPWLPQ
jgi:membrane protease YdiL (CAAX protease family)